MINFVKRNDKPNNAGLYAVRLRITKERQRKYFTLKIFVDNEHWDAKNERFIIERNVRSEERREENDLRKRYNYMLDQIFTEAQTIIDKFKYNKIDWTLNQFEDAFLNQTRKGKIKPYFESIIKTLKATNHIGNAAAYERTMYMLAKFDSKFESRLFADIDIKYVRNFDVFLQKRGANGNTRYYYIKILRALLNKAIQEKEASSSTYPFDKGGFEVSKLQESTAKRYLPKEHLAQLLCTASAIPNNEYARKLFMFSYYCFGMSFVDMASLRASNVEKHDDGDYIVYKRQKVKNQKNVRIIRIKITGDLRSIIDSLNYGVKRIENYLIPIVTKEYNGEQLYNHIRGRYRKYNNYLADLAKEFGITDFNLTTYVSRHTMAMTLQSNNIAREVISQMLGHKDMKITNTYLDSFDTNTIDEAAKVLYQNSDQGE